MGGLAALDLTGNTNPPANISQPPIANFLVSANLYKNLYKHERLYMYCEWPFTLYFLSLIHI